MSVKNAAWTTQTSRVNNAVMGSKILDKTCLLVEAYPSRQASTDFVNQLALVEEEIYPAVFGAGQTVCPSRSCLEPQRKAFAQVRERDILEAFN